MERQVVAIRSCAAAPEAVTANHATTTTATRTTAFLPARQGHAAPVIVNKPGASAFVTTPLRYYYHANRTDGIVEASMTRVLIFALATLALIPAGARAQEQQSFKSIIGRGFEIKSVTFMRGETSENREVFLVTLQKEKSVAVCYFAAASWVNLSTVALEDAKRCDIR
jgi:hypothetical protein